MALSSRDRVGKGLEIFGTAFGRYVDQRMTTRTPLGGHWRATYPEANLDGDVSAQIGVVLDHGDGVFRDFLNGMGRTLVHEVRQWRNRWAHNENFSDDDADRALDTMQRLMTQIGVKEPVEIRSSPSSPGHPTAMVETKSFLPRVGGSSTAIRFMDDEAGYAEWLRGHPSGYVLNCDREPQASYLPLHRATCSTISGRPTRGDTWTVAYIKVCADTAQELENWARERTGASPRPCGRCHP